MSPRGVSSEGRAAVEDELLAQLGLPPSASPEDLDQLHQAASEYLAAAPASIRGWAHAQVAALDSTYLQLTDPVGLEGSALRSPTRPPTVVPGGPATPPARRDSASAVVPAAVVAAAALADDDDEADDDEDDEDEDEALAIDGEPDAEDLAALYASVTPSAHADMAPAAKAARASKKQRREARRAAAAAAAPIAAPAPAAPNVWKRAVIGGAIVLAAVGIGFGANMVVNGNSGTPAASDVAQATQTAPSVDMAKVNTLMQTLQTNPNDITTLLALGDEYYFGQDFATAATFYDKVIAIDAKNTKALNAQGAIAYNKNDLPGAEKIWLQVVGIDPANTEAHFNLGFLYLNQPTPDISKMLEQWNLVIKLDPTSQFAQVAQAHLDSLAKSSMLPGASGGPSASPAASGAASPGPSAAPSAAPSASAAANVVNQTALSLAFGSKELAAPADTAFTLHFDNQEAGLPHDMQIVNAAGTVVFAGTQVIGPAAVDYSVPALPAGTYTFKCSIHPTMTGTLKVGS